MSEENGRERATLAPVIPLFDAPADDIPERRASIWDGDDGPSDDDRGEAGADDARATELDLAEKALLKKLRVRQLSMSEARRVLAEQDLAADDAQSVLDEFERLGYLDDARLAEQVVYASVERKSQGRQAIAQSLAKRGVPRDVADEALAALPDDDADRALEFARQKARSMSGLDREVALRRLHGQLARRGFPGSAASSAARTALDELAARSPGVRFR